MPTLISLKRDCKLLEDLCLISSILLQTSLSRFFNVIPHAPETNLFLQIICVVMPFINGTKDGLDRGM